MTTDTEAGVWGQDGTQAKPSRNFLSASIVGVLLLGLILGLAYFTPLGFTIFIYTVCLAMLPELRRAFARQGRVVSLIPLSAATIGMGVSVWYDGREGLIVALLIGAGGTIAWRLVDEWVEDSLHDALADVLALVWIPFFASFAALMVQSEGGWVRVFVLVAALAGNDTGALLVGMTFGRHRMAPKISPKKTWEGAIGGILIGTGAATGVWYLFMNEGEWWLGAAVGFAVTIAGIFGDLVESAIKRDTDIKDMGGALPGHGGVLDRLDSALLASPVAYVLFAEFLGTL
jgi:phosphatidate cytidylyltransferase